jgi:hypothetical protein
MKSDKKKKWETPRLEILSRITPEECILLRCKHQNSNTPLDPGNTVQVCGAVAGGCAACNARGQS